MRRLVKEALAADVDIDKSAELFRTAKVHASMSRRAAGGSTERPKPWRRECIRAVARADRARSSMAVRPASDSRFARGRSDSIGRRSSGGAPAGAPAHRGRMAQADASSPERVGLSALVAAVDPIETAVTIR